MVYFNAGVEVSQGQFTWEEFVNFWLGFARRWNLGLVPLKRGDKKPLVRGWKDLSLEEAEKFLKQGRCNVGFLLKGRIFVVDVDDLKKVPFVEKLFQKDTFTVRTRRGFHFYFLASDFVPKSFKGLGFDILAEPRFVVAPFCEVDGVRYEVLNNGEIKDLTFDEFVGIFPGVRKGFRGDGVEEVIRELLESYWEVGQRQNLALYLAGFLRKKGIPKEVAKEVVRRIAEAMGDEEIEKRLSAVDYTYAPEKAIGELKGLSGLEDILNGDVLERLKQIVKEWQVVGFSDIAKECLKYLSEKGVYLAFYREKEGWVMVDVRSQSLVWREVGEEEVKHLFVQAVANLMGRFMDLDKELFKLAYSIVTKGVNVDRLVEIFVKPVVLKTREELRGSSEFLYSPSKKIVLRPSFEIVEKDKGNKFSYPEATFDSFSCDPDFGKASQFLGFLEEVFGNERRVEFFLNCIAWALVPGVKRKVFWLVGPARSGKSTLVRVLEGVLGTYAVSVPSAIFFKKRENPVNPFLAKLAQARLAFILESGAPEEINVEFIKKLGAGDTVAYRYLYSNVVVEEELKAIPVFVANKFPEFSSYDDALVDRIIFFTTYSKVPVERVRGDLAERILREEGAKILGEILKRIPGVMRLGDKLFLENPFRHFILWYFFSRDPIALIFGRYCEGKAEEFLPYRVLAEKLRELAVFFPVESEGEERDWEKSLGWWFKRRYPHLIQRRKVGGRLERGIVGFRFCKERFEEDIKILEKEELEFIGQSEV